MNLSSEACLILNDPMKYLHMEHSRKEVIGSDLIWATLHRRNYQETGRLPKEVFVKALKSIRKFASQRGKLGEEKELIHQSILSYSKKVCHKFGSVNQLNYHLKGLYGCELPKKFRDRMHKLIVEGEDEGETEVSPTTEPSPSPSTKELTLGGLKFSLSTGSSLTIGELATDSIDLKGMREVKIEKVSEGRLFGVCLKV